MERIGGIVRREHEIVGVVGKWQKGDGRTGGRVLVDIGGHQVEGQKGESVGSIVAIQ